jgi:hypothetical protein
MITAWINSINTTSFRIVVSVVVAAVLLTLLTAAVVFVGFKPDDGQMRLLYAMGGLLGAMMSLDVLQFVGKRFSDAEYVSAKKGPSPVTVEAPSTVSVTAPIEAPRVAPVSEEVAASPASAPPVVLPPALLVPPTEASD